MWLIYSTAILYIAVVSHKTNQLTDGWFQSQNMFFVCVYAQSVAVIKGDGGCLMHPEKLQS